MVHGQTLKSCSGGLTFGVWAVVVALTQVLFRNLEMEGMQWRYRHGSGSFAVELLWLVMTCLGVPGLDVGSTAGDPNHLLQCQMKRWTLRCPHFCHNQSPDQYCHPSSVLINGTKVICNAMYKGKLFEVNHLIDSEDWLLCWMRVLSQGVLLDSSVNCDSSPHGP